MLKKINNAPKILKSIRSFIPRRIAIKSAKNDYFDGIVLCADISGFTTMSEKLTSSGKEGSEEISKIINSFFKPLVKIIDKNGGDIFFFGGDAITAVFDFNNSAAALKTAEESVNFVKELGAVKTSQGVFSIKIHIALTKGKIFLKQTENLFMLSGNTCFRVIKLLDHAKKQEIIIDTALKNSIENLKCKLVKKGIYRYRGMESTVIKAKRHILPKIDQRNLKSEIRRINQFLPRWMERRMEIKQTFDQKDGEHRKAAIVFMHFRKMQFDEDIKNTSVLSGKLADALNLVSEKYGVWVNKIDFYKDGIRALVIFGFPTKLENDERHAIMFTNDMLKDNDLKGIDMRIGINSGLIFGTPIGSIIRREYTVMGDTVNIAARIAAKAKSREITVGENTFRKTEHLFNYKKAIEKKFKGKSKRISNYIVIGEKGSKSGHSQIGEWISESKKLIGHKMEIKEFRKSMNLVKNSKGRIIAFTGEAGLGKSRILSEFIKMASKSKFEILEGSCPSYGKTLSYYPWIEILNRIFRILPNDTLTKKKQKIIKRMNKMSKDIKLWLPLIGEVMGIEFPMNAVVKNLDSKIKKQKFFDIVFEILISLSMKKPLCIVIEDVHWMDSTSLELLNYITRNIMSRKILFLLAYRPIKEKVEFRDKEYCSQYAMTELTENETMELVENLLNIKQLPSSFKSLLLKRSQGNPFYVEEIVKSLIEQEFIRMEKKKWVFKGNIKNIKLPDSVEGVILSRMDRLDLIERDVIQIASVLGREFDEDILTGIYGDTKRLKKSLHILRSLDLVKRDNKNRSKYFFKHILTSETAYNTLSFERKREIHHDVAIFIEKTNKGSIDEFLGILSYHYYLSKNYDKALIYSVKAGDKAKNVYANEEAIEFYTRAIDSYEQSEKK